MWSRSILLVVVLAGCSRGGVGQAEAEAVEGRLRVVTLTPSATEIVAALGAAEWLVGVDDYSTYPESVARLPKVGSFLQPSREAILRLRPDVVVLAKAQPEAAQGLADAGLTTVVLDIHDLDDVKEGLVQVGAALGREAEAGAAVQALEHAIAAARQRAGARGRRSVLLSIDHEVGGLSGLIAAGAHTYLHELASIVGLDNVLAGAPVPYPQVSAEHVVRAAPDLILDAAAETDADARRAWARLSVVPAVREQRVYGVGHPIFRAPTPRADQALARLERLLDAAEAR